MSLVQDRITRRGYWKIRVFPASFDRRRIGDVSDLRTLVRDLAVELGGISFPTVSNRALIGNDWIGQDIDEGEYCQAWRLYQSAQLALYEGFIDDWLDRSLFGTEEGWHPGAQLSVGDILTTYWQTFEFAARLATAVGGQDPITVSVHSFGLKDRKLLYRFPNRLRLRATYVATIPDFATTTTLARDELVSAAVQYSVQGARDLLVRFGWDVDPEFLRTLLGESGFPV
jgi:hypothetical protein